MALSGSPSLRFTTTTGRRRECSRTVRTFLANGNAAPPRPRRSVASAAARSASADGRGSGPCRRRCADHPGPSVEVRQQSGTWLDQEPVDDHRTTSRDSGRAGSGRPSAASREAPARATATRQAHTGSTAQGRWSCRSVPSANACADSREPGRPHEQVHHPPAVQAHAVPQQRGGHDGQQQVDGDRAEAHPHRAVAGPRRHHDLPPGDVDEAVRHRGADVHPQEAHGQQGQVAVQGEGGEPRDARHSSAARWPAAR